MDAKRLSTIFKAAARVYDTMMVFDMKKVEAADGELKGAFADVLESKGEKIFVFYWNGQDVAVVFGLTREDAEPFSCFCHDEFTNIFYPQEKNPVVTGGLN
jgi:hypothetical protein